MLFKPTRLKGACLIEPHPITDERGYFMRTFCMIEFAHNGLEVAYVQHNVSYTRLKGTVRGMHFQLAPHAETKVVTCTQGAIHDVIVDLRPASRTYLKWQAFELSAENRKLLYVPAGFAHGFQSLTDDVEVSYLISEFYVPHAAAGIRHDDPALAIRWPLPVSLISEKDRRWPRIRVPVVAVKPPRAAGRPRRETAPASTAARTPARPSTGTPEPERHGLRNGAASLQVVSKSKARAAKAAAKKPKKPEMAKTPKSSSKPRKPARPRTTGRER